MRVIERSAIDRLSEKVNKISADLSALNCTLPQSELDADTWNDWDEKDQELEDLIKVLGLS